MKNLKTQLKKGFLLLTAFAFIGLLSSPLVTPKTVEASVDAYCTSARLNGHIEPNGSPTTVWFEWGPGSSISYSTATQTFTTPSNFSQTLSNLTENTQYSYRAMASNANGTSTGETISFRTNTCAPTQTNPTVNLTADDSSIPYNSSTTLRWNSSNATSCTANGGVNGWSGSKNLSGTFNTGSLSSTTTYNITCSNSVGSASDSVTVTVGGAPIDRPTVSISADDTSLDSGDNTTVRWNSSNADTCTGSGGSNGWSGSRTLSGSFNTGSLTNTRTFTITCSNSSGSATDSVTINVNDQGDRPTVDIRADDTTLDSGDSTIIRWDSDNADTCRASGGRNGWSGNRNTSGSFDTGDLTASTTYHITCTNEFGSADDSVTVRVEEDEDEPTVNISASPSNVSYGGTSTVTWTSQNADSCTANGGVNGWSGTRSRSGSFYTGQLYNNTTFSITCRNENGSANDSVTISVGNQVNNVPTVVLSADSTNVAFNGATTIRWSTTNATSCNATGGSTGWSGTRSIGPGSFYTGSLTGTRTYSMTCSNSSGSASDSVTVSVRGQVLGTSTPASAYLIVSSSVDRNRPIVPTLDNTNPCPGDDINYTLTYQNIGTASVRNIVLRIDLPVEVDFLTSSPSNPSQSGNTLIFNLGSLGANKQGKVTIRTRLQDSVPAGTNLNFPATMTYVDPSGAQQSVSADVSANVCGEVAVNQIDNNDNNGTISLGASVFGAGFLPDSVLGWLLLLILILILVVLVRHLFAQSFARRTVTTYNPTNGQSTTTTL